MGAALFHEQRYEWPSEPDPTEQIAELAGLALESRWGGWRREPFAASSTFAVPGYRRQQ